MNFKKFAVYVLVIVLTIGCFSKVTFSDNLKIFDKGNGSKASPYEISAPFQLDAVRLNLEAYYILNCDIDLSEWGYWEPIGSSGEDPFKGFFDGNNYKIKNMSIKTTDTSSRIYAGLFGYTNGSEIKNIGVTDVNIDVSANYANTGGVAGYSYRSVINNCYSTGDIANNSSTVHAGGIIGSGYNVSIQNSYSHCNVSAYSKQYSAFAGGIIGNGDPTGYTVIDDCYSSGNIFAQSLSNSFAGGIISNITGSNNSGNSILKSCYNTGDVSSYSMSAFSYAGGIAGYVSSMTSENCYSTGRISSSANSNISYAGGIVGYLLSSSVKNTQNDGYIFSNNSHTAISGGIVGYTDYSKVTDSVNNSNIFADSNQNNSYVGGIVGYNTSLTLIQDNVNYGDISSKAAINSNAGGIVGLSTNEIQINNCQNKCDINVSAPAVSIGGIIGRAEDTEIRNCESYGNFTSDSTSKYSLLGGIVGHCGNLILENSKSSGNISSDNFSGLSIGGLAGSVSVANLSNCQSLYDDSYIKGAFIGTLENNLIFNPFCYYTNENLNIVGEKIGNISGIENVLLLSDSVNQNNNYSVMFKVVDSDSMEAVSNATVSVYGNLGVTNENGVVIIDDITRDSNIVTVESNDYYKSISLFNYSTSELPIYLTKRKQNDIHIVNVNTYLYDGSVRDVLDTNSVDILKDDNNFYRITCNVDWNSNTLGDIILQAKKSGKSFNLVNGSISLKFGEEFDVGEEFFISAVSGDSIVTVPLNIEVHSLPKALSLGFHDIESSPITGIPILENKTFKMGLCDYDLLDIADNVYCKDNKLIIESSNKPIIKKVAFLGNDRITLGLDYNFKIPLQNILNDSWTGYFKTKSIYSDKNEHDKALITTYKQKVSLPTFIGEIPLWIKLRLNSDFYSNLNVKGSYDALNFNGDIKNDFDSDLFLDVGALDYKDISVRIYSDTNVKAPISLNPPSINPNVSISAFISTLSKSWKFENMIGYGNFNQYEKMQLIGRDYLNSDSGFVGDKIEWQGTNRKSTMIYKNVFPSTQCEIQITNGTPIMVYTIDDLKREEQDCLKLVYSIYENSSWQEPKAVYDDGTMDSNLNFNGNCIVWENMRNKLSREVCDFKEVMSESEILFSEFDGKSWSEPIAFTNNSIADFSPIVRVSDNKKIVAWLSNTESDISGSTGITNINYKIFDGINWSELKIIENVGEVSRIDAAYNGTNYRIIYQRNNFLFSANGAPIHSEAISQYNIAYCNGSYFLATFDSDGMLTVIKDLDGNREYKTVVDTNSTTPPIIVGNNNKVYICWVERVNGLDVLSGVIYDNGKFSDKIILLQSDSNLKSPSIDIDSDDRITVAYFNEHINDLIYSQGETDLFVTEIQPDFNIAIEKNSLYYDDYIYGNTGIAVIGCVLKNIGLEEINGYKIFVYDDEKLIGEFEKNDVLNVSECKNVVFNLELEKSNEKQKLTVKILPKNSFDFDESDNFSEIELGNKTVTINLDKDVQICTAV